MTVPAHTLRDGLSTVMEARALNLFQHRRLFNADPEVNSLAERIAHLRHYGVPDDVIKALFEDVRALLISNGAEGGCLNDLAGQLDDLARIAHRDERAGEPRNALTVKAIARTLSPHLKVLAAPCDHDALEFVRAVRAVDRVIAQVPRAQLTGSLRNELGAPRHDLLLSLIERGVEASA